jgi:hypothetical protein
LIAAKAEAGAGTGGRGTGGEDVALDGAAEAAGRAGAVPPGEAATTVGGALATAGTTGGETTGVGPRDAQARRGDRGARMSAKLVAMGNRRGMPPTVTPSLVRSALLERSDAVADGPTPR